MLQTFFIRSVITLSSLCHCRSFFCHCERRFLSLRGFEEAVAISPFPIWGGEKTLLNTPPKKY